MIEQKLHTAAEALPQPETTFASILHTAHQKSPAKSPKRRRAIALILALLLLGGCAAGAAAYSATMGYGTNFYTEAAKIAARLDVQLPEQLGQSPFHSATIGHIYNRDIPWLLGPLISRYERICISYGSFDADLEDVYSISLMFGSTEKPLWRYSFSFTGDDIWCPDTLDPATYASEPYRGILLQSGTLDLSHSRSGTVVWIDEELDVCFWLSSTYYTMDEMRAFAKEIIDLNHPD